MSTTRFTESGGHSFYCLPDYHLNAVPDQLRCRSIFELESAHRLYFNCNIFTRFELESWRLTIHDPSLGLCYGHLLMVAQSRINLNRSRGRLLLKRMVSS
jgi:hypothetical protein